VADLDPLEGFRSSVAPDEARHERIKHQFRARIATMPADEHGRRPFDPPTPAQPVEASPRQRPALVLVGLVLVVGLAAAGVLGARHRDAGFGGPSVSELAATAAQQPDVSLDAGQYLYQREQSADEAGAQSERQQWTARDGTGQAVVSAMALEGPGSSTPSLSLYPTPGALTFAGLGYDQLRSLPTDSTGLRQRLRVLGVVRGTDAHDEAEALASILALTVTPPEVARAAIEALADIGGEAAGPVTDATGRSGSSISGDNGDGTTWLAVFDGTGRAIAFSPRVPAGADPSEASPRRLWSDQQITSSLSVR
jgi:hypothetical protein